MANIADLLGEPLASDLADFRAANYRAKEIEVIREALEEHIKLRLEEPKMLERFNAARENRRKGDKKPLRLIRPAKDC